MSSKQKNLCNTELTIIAVSIILYTIYIISVIYIKYGLRLSLDKSTNVCIMSFAASFVIKIINWLWCLISINGMKGMSILIDTFTTWSLLLILYYFTFEMNSVYQHLVCKDHKEYLKIKRKYQIMKSTFYTVKIISQICIQVNYYFRFLKHNGLTEENNTELVFFIIIATISLLADFIMVIFFLKLFRFFVTYKIFRLKEQGLRISRKIKFIIFWVLFMVVIFSTILVTDVVESVLVVQKVILDSDSAHRYLIFTNMILPTAYFFIGMSLL